MNKLLSIVISCCLLVDIIINLPVVYTQDNIHSLPSGLIFVAHDRRSYDGRVNYVDPTNHEIQTLFYTDTGRAYWSPDGSQIAVIDNSDGNERFCTYVFEEQGNIQCVGGDTFWGDVQLLSFPIAWHPDSQHVHILLETPDGLPRLGFIDTANREIQTGHTLQLNGEILHWIHWSPDGQYLAYQTQSLAEQQSPHLPGRYNPLSLYLMNIESGETRLLSPWSHDWCVSWSNNSQQLGAVLFRWFDRDFDARMTSGLTVFNTAGDIVNHIQPRYAGRNVFGCTFSWSPDDTQIAYFSDYIGPDGGNTTGIFIVATDNLNAYLLADGMMAPPFTIAWSPEGSHLTVSTALESRNDIRILSLDGWEWLYENDSTIISNPVWQPLGYGVGP